MDVLGGRSRIRLDAGPADRFDDLIEGGVARLIPASTSGSAEALLSAEPSVWSEIAGDVRAGIGRA